AGCDQDRNQRGYIINKEAVPGVGIGNIVIEDINYNEGAVFEQQGGKDEYLGVLAVGMLQFPGIPCDLPGYCRQHGKDAYPYRVFERFEIKSVQQQPDHFHNGYDHNSKRKEITQGDGIVGIIEDGQYQGNVDNIIDYADHIGQVDGKARDDVEHIDQTAPCPVKRKPQEEAVGPQSFDQYKEQGNEIRHHCSDRDNIV